MVQGFFNKLGNAKNRLADALLGVQATTNQPLTQQYPSELEEYLNDIDKQDYMQNLLNQPKETGLTLDQYKEGIAQGLNFGIPQIAEKQKELGIVTPKTAEEIDSAKLGEFNKYPALGLSTTSRVGGIIPDMLSGYKDNYATGFAAPNWQNNTLPDGRNKGFAYRLGEGLGTVGRFVDSPLGRGILAAGLNSALGYDNSLQEGLTAAVGRQNAQTADRVYRQQLEAQGIDTSNIGGNINDSIYKQILYGQQLRDNADYRNLMLKSMDENRKETVALKKAEAEYRKQKDKEDREDKALNRAITKRGQDLNYSLGLQRISANSKQAKEDKKAQDNINALNSIKGQLDRFSNTFNDANNPYRYRIAGGASNALNTLTKTEANFNAQRTLLFNKIARELGGEKGVLSDQDIKRIEQALPTLSDTKAQKQAKMEAIYNLLDDRMKQFGYVSNTQNDDEGWAF